MLFLLGCDSKQLKIKVNNGTQIRNATIITFDSLGKLERYQGTIVFDSSRIVYSGPLEPIVKGQYEKINATGKFVIPGLIDSHVHIANVAGMNFWQQRKHPELLKPYFDQLPKSFLYFGYTTLIDVNNYAPPIINKILESELRPDIYACGEMLSVMHDFTMEMDELPLRIRLQSPFIYDNYNDELDIPDSIDLQSHTVKAIVKNNIEANNAICTKTLYEDASSGMRETWEKPTMNILKDIVEETKRMGAISIIHAPSFEGQKVAVEANMDIIAHAMWNWSSDPKEITNYELSADHKRLLDEIIGKNIGYQPTYRAITAEVDVINDSFLDDENLKYILPKSFINWLHTDEADWFLKRILNRPKYLTKTNPDFFIEVRNQFESDSAMRDSIYKVLNLRIDNITRYLAQNEANLLFGTDFGVMNMYTSPPGYSGFLEMKHWMDAGVELQTILKAATLNNAKSFNLSHLYGTIEEGKIANLLLLNSDPLKDINAYNNIYKIVLHGKTISRQELSAK